MTKPDIIQQIIAIASKHPEPENFFHGVDAPIGALPLKVLQFHRARQLEVESSIHYRFVLITVLEEPGMIIVDGELYNLEPGQGFLVFPFQSHHYTTFKHPEKVKWLFTTFEHNTPDAFKPLVNTAFTYSPPEQNKMLKLVKTFQSWATDQNDIGLDAPLELALLLSGLVRQQRAYVKKAGGKSLLDTPEQKFIRQIAHYIYDNLSQPMQIKDIAKEMSLSPSRLRAKFRDTANVSLGEFIRRTRVHKACGLLHSSNLNVTETAEACGFESLYSFSRTFKKNIGRSPLEFRQHVRGKERV